MSLVTNFKLDFSEWEWRMVLLEDCPQSEVEEIKNAIRQDWQDEEKKKAWMVKVASEAEFSRELKAMGKGITDRIKASLAKERLEK